MNKFFGNKSPRDHLFEEAQVFATPLQSQRETFPPGLIKPCPFIRPLEHKLQARSEPRGAMPRFLKKARSFDTISTCRSSVPHVATHRETRNRVLSNSNSSGFAALHGDEVVADSSTKSSMTDLQLAGHREVPQNDMETHISQQLDHVAKDAAEDSLTVDHWDYYIQCYSKVR